MLLLRASAPVEKEGAASFPPHPNHLWLVILSCGAEPHRLREFSLFSLLEPPIRRCAARTTQASFDSGMRPRSRWQEQYLAAGSVETSVSEENFHPVILSAAVRFACESHCAVEGPLRLLILPHRLREFSLFSLLETPIRSWAARTAQGSFDSGMRPRSRWQEQFWRLAQLNLLFPKNIPILSSWAQQYERKSRSFAALRMTNQG